MDITVSRSISPNYTALKMQHSRKDKKVISRHGDWGEYKGVEATLKPLGEVADIEIKPIIVDDLYQRGMQITVDSLDKSEGNCPYVMEITNAEDLYNETIINTQRMVKELIQGDMSGAVYTPDNGAVPRDLERAVPKLEKMAKKGYNIYVLPHTCGISRNAEGYNIFVEKPGFETFKKKRPNYSIYENPNSQREIYSVPYTKLDYTHPYHWAVHLLDVGISGKNLSNLITDTAKFYIDNIEKDKPNQIYYC